jgi:uncharacterized protein (DUF1501 family)
MQTTRRALITTGMLSALGWASRPASATLSALACAVPARGKKPEPRHVLVTIFLRGAADGLSVVPPYAEDEYYRLRPTLALTAPGDARAKAKDRIVDLDGHFGLHPSLAPLAPIYRSGELAFIHACGSGDETLSHFEAMATMERGLHDDTGGAASGWLARHLDAMDEQEGSNAAALRAVAIADTLPQSLAGATGVTVLQRVSEIALNLPFHAGDRSVMNALQAMYGNGKTPIQQAGGQSLELLRTLSTISPASNAARHGAAYPNDDLGVGLQQVAILIRSGIGLEVACLDHMGYDTHVAQGGSNGILAGRLEALGGSLAAFRTDLGPELWSRTTVTVQTEFGRRVEENSGLGTDHGRGGVMMVMSGCGVDGGKVWGRWPGLKSDQLDGPGDLQVTTDYRDVLAEILARRCGQTAPPQRVFPGLAYQPLGMIHA